MEGLTPKKPSFFERFGTPLYFLGGLAALCLLVVIYFSNKHTAPDENNAVTTAPAPALAQETAPVPAAAPQRAVGQAFRPAHPPPATPVSQAESVVAQSSARSPTPAAEPNQVAIEFDLVSRDVMMKMSDGGDGNLDVGRYSMSVVPQFKTKMDSVRSDPGFKSLASETRNLALGQPSLVFRGGKEPKSNDTIGFFVEVTPNRQGDRGVEYHLSIKRNIPDVSPTGELKVNSQNFDETVNVPRDSAILMAGLLPRKVAMLEGEDELYKTNILKAFLDPAFEKGDSEFIIVINPHFSEPTN